MSKIFSMDVDIEVDASIPDIVKVYTIDDQDDGGNDIKVYIPGPPGPPGPIGPGSAIVEINTYSTPTVLTNGAVIPAPVNQREKRYIASAGGIVVVTVASSTGTKELYLVGTNASLSDQVGIDISTNMLSSGPWYARLGSLISLQWTPVLLKWLEVSRNEI